MDGENHLTDPNVRAAIDRHVERSRGTTEYLQLIKTFQSDGLPEKLVAIMVGDADDSMKVEAAAMLSAMPPDGPKRLRELAFHQDVNARRQIDTSDFADGRRPGLGNSDGSCVRSGSTLRCPPRSGVWIGPPKTRSTSFDRTRGREETSRRYENVGRSTIGSIRQRFHSRSRRRVVAATAAKKPEAPRAAGSAGKEKRRIRTTV